MSREQTIQAALQALGQGRVDAASALAAPLLQAEPEHPDVLYLRGEIACAQGRNEDAVALFAQAIGHAPVPWMLQLRLAELLLFLRRRRQAHALITQASEAAGTQARVWSLCGKAFAKCNDFQAAARCHDRVTRLEPAYPAAWHELAMCRYFLGQTQAAQEAIAQVLRLAPPDAPLVGHALYLRATLRRWRAEEHHVEDLRQRLASGLRDPEARAAAQYALAKELEDLGEDTASFAALADGARLRRQRLRPDVAGEVATMEAIARTWTAQAVREAHPGHEEAGAIFIVGLPRTGTTLTERLLCAHGGVTPAGELLDLPQLVQQHARAALQGMPGATLVEGSTRIDMAQLGREYMRGAREAAHGADVFIDKLPVNFQYLGILCAALPQAKVVLVRRDPMDAAYAIHKTLFNAAYHWSCDLAQVADFIAASHRLMAHWQAVLPGRICVADYEALVADPAGEGARLRQWCGLEAAVPDSVDAQGAIATASAAQVREPVHARSVGAWKRHADALEDTRRRLIAHGLIAG